MDQFNKVVKVGTSGPSVVQKLKEQVEWVLVICREEERNGDTRGTGYLRNSRGGGRVISVGGNWARHGRGGEWGRCGGAAAVIWASMGTQQRLLGIAPVQISCFVAHTHVSCVRLNIRQRTPQIPALPDTLFCAAGKAGRAATSVQPHFSRSSSVANSDLNCSGFHNKENSPD